jgi:membrane protein YdbS with pleckstrin-like domain
MKDRSRSAVVRRHLRHALVLGWTAYFAGLLAAVTLGLGVYALGTDSVWWGAAGLVVTAALSASIVAALFYCLNERNDRRDQWYLRLALRSSYLRAHPEAVGDQRGRTPMRPS